MNTISLLEIANIIYKRGKIVSTSKERTQADHVLSDKQLSDNHWEKNHLDHWYKVVNDIEIVEYLNHLYEIELSFYHIAVRGKSGWISYSVDQTKTKIIKHTEIL